METAAATAGPIAAVFGCAGPVLSDDERAFFADADPVGFILFARNCEDPDQVRRLTADLRDSVGRANAPVLIDQEGGRVQRLGPPHWRAAPPAGVFGTLAWRDRETAEEAVRLNASLIAYELHGLGINVDCAPVVDVLQPDTHDVIGDRAFATDPEIVAELGMAASVGLFLGGVIPVIKHIPGHGRARADSHLELPVVEATAAELEAADLVPFKALSRMPWAMTAHVVYTAFDPDNPATTSRRVIDQIIRDAIGFEGVLLSDDIGMKALDGPIRGRAEAALAAGCDIVLHCSGDLDEMREVAEGTGALTEGANKRLARGRAMLKHPDDMDFEGNVARLDELLAQASVS